ncbi:hypothetical protein N9U65_01470 [Planctomycetaceae bacterium]|nr:hypothetical protein [Planctomycetaceae bacterium]
MVTSHRTCRECFEIKPVNEFRFLSKQTEDRSTQCRTCHNRAEKIRRSAKAKSKRVKAISNAANKLRRDPSDNQVRAICQQMITQFHGVDGFVKQWFSVWETDRAKGRAKCFAHVAAVVRLIEYVDDHRTDYRARTDDEIEEWIKEIQSST